jgi:NRAMP (natural resistance-associated macrophage protein)-like metal ion transporter
MAKVGAVDIVAQGFSSQNMGAPPTSFLEKVKQNLNPFKKSAEFDNSAGADAGLAGSMRGVSMQDAGGKSRWSPSGSAYKDMLYFLGPGWMVMIAYVDPGNYQADINSGATTGYSTLWAVWWTSILSIYVQVLCCRLAIHAQVTLAEVQAADNPRYLRYLNWFIAEFSAVITDLPEVIGIGIACNVFFGWPYWIGTLLSFVTTMGFLFTIGWGMRILESIVLLFIGIMSIALFVEMSFIPQRPGELMKGWVYGFVDVTAADLFTITGILGAVVMPHNLYLHTAAVQSRRIVREEAVIKQAVKWTCWEPVVPIVFSFFINMAIVAIAAEQIYYDPDVSPDTAANVGLTDFCRYFEYLKGGCILWGLALLAAGQSSAITTTFTGQYVMDGFLHIRLPLWARAVVTRATAIVPCVLVAALIPDKLNMMVNIVNSALAFLLPFAFTPLVKYVASPTFMGEHAAPVWERVIMWVLVVLIWFVNALSLFYPGGGFFGVILFPDGDITNYQPTTYKNGMFFLMVFLEVFYFVWNVYTAVTPPSAPMRTWTEERPYVKGEFGSVQAMPDYLKKDKSPEEEPEEPAKV